MNHDQLYLLKPDFLDEGKIYFCPGCAEMVGLMEFYPVLRQCLKVNYVAFQRPRMELI